MSWLVWGKMALLLFAIFVFGTRASRSADIIAEKKRWSRAFMGVIFLAAVTSLPELFTGISAVRIVKDPNMALGEIFGSCVFNFFIIALVDFFLRKKAVFALKRPQETIRPFFYFLIMMAATTVLIPLGLGIGIAHVGLSSLVIFGLYLLIVRVMYGQRRKGSGDQEICYRTKSLRKETWSFVFSSLVIIAVGIYLPVVGDEIIRQMGWSSSFVGVVFLAFVTSFPELIVCLAAARLQAFEMMFGNISGSNLFNLSIIFIVDIFFFEGILLQNVSPVFPVIGGLTVVMSLVVIQGLRRRPGREILGMVSLNSLLLTICYLAAFFLSYQ